MLAHPSLGSILVGPNGHTLYVFDRDEPGASNCTGGCASAWPPFAVRGELAPAASITANFGAITRGEGTSQATANGLPLYYYSGDSAPGDFYGQGVGNVWWVVRADGTAARPEPEPTQAPPPPTPTTEPEPTQAPPPPTPTTEPGYGY